MFDNRAPDDDTRSSKFLSSIFNLATMNARRPRNIHENVYPLFVSWKFPRKDGGKEKRKQREEKYVGHAKLVRSCVRFIVEKGWRVGGRPRKFRKLHFRRDETNAEEAKKSLPRYVI